MFKVSADTKIAAVSRDFDLGENAKLRNLPNGELLKQLKKGDKLHALLNVPDGRSYSVWYEVKDYTRETDTLQLSQLMVVGPYIQPDILQIPKENMN